MKPVMEQQKVEIAEKRNNLNQRGYHVADIPFCEGSMSTSSGVLEIVRSVKVMEMEQL